MVAVKILFLVLIGYACGNFSSARIVARAVGKNITEIGSGNPGSMNILRNLGFKYGIITLLADGLKAAIPSLLGLFLLGEYGIFIGGFSCIIGHIFPVVFKFVGGKGVACAFGMFSVACWWLAIPLFIIMTVCIRIFKIGSICSLLYILIMSILLTILVKVNAVSYVIIWLNCALVFWTHRKNIVRILKGQETKTTFHKSTTILGNTEHTEK